MPLNSADYIFDRVGVEDRGVFKNDMPYSDVIGESHFLLSSSV